MLSAHLALKLFTVKQKLRALFPPMIVIEAEDKASSKLYTFDVRAQAPQSSILSKLQKDADKGLPISSLFM